jgi:hypothetical protein
LDRLLATGAHEFRIALYRADKSLHLERQGLAELQPGDHNLLAIRVVKRSKMLVKRDAELEIRWPGRSAPNDTKQPGSIEAASAAPVSAR